MKTLVTGATGLLGNNLVRQLRARGDQVTGLVAAGSSRWALSDPLPAVGGTA